MRDFHPSISIKPPQLSFRSRPGTEEFDKDQRFTAVLLGGRELSESRDELTAYEEALTILKAHVVRLKEKCAEASEKT